MNETHHTFLGTLTMLIVLSGCFAAAVAITERTPQQAAAIEAVPAAPSFDELELRATSAYVYDLAHQEVLFAKNPEQQLPLASITKVMLALVADEALPDNARVSIGPDALSTDGDSGLLLHEEWVLGDLIDFTLVSSSNDGAIAIATRGGYALAPHAVDDASARAAFVAHMNERAAALSLEQTYFLNPTGLDMTESISGAYGSARDVAELFAYTLRARPELLAATANASVTAISDTDKHIAESTNVALRTIPNMIAGKTGYTDLAGGTLVTAFDTGLGHPVVAVVLGSTLDERFSDMQAIADALFAVSSDAHTP